MKVIIEILFLIFLILVTSTISISKAFEITVINDFVDMFVTEYKIAFISALSLVAAYAFYQITFYKKELSFLDKLQYNLGLCFFILFIYLTVQETNA